MYSSYLYEGEDLSKKSLIMNDKGQNQYKKITAFTNKMKIQKEIFIAQRK